MGFENAFHLGDEPVALAQGGFHKERVFGVVIQRRTDFANGIIDAVLGIEEEVLPPDLLDDFFSLDQVTLVFSQQDQQLHGLALQTEAMASTTELEAIGIELVIPE